MKPGTRDSESRGQAGTSCCYVIGRSERSSGGTDQSELGPDQRNLRREGGA